MDWLEDLDQHVGTVRDAEDTASVARGIVEICLRILVRFSLSTDARIRMLPNQWDVALYHGDKRWEIKKEFDFSELGEVLLIDDSPRGAGLFTEFLLVKGQNTVRTGFIVPERIGEGRRNFYFIAYEHKVGKAALAEMWKAIKPGVEAWYESLLRGDITPLLEVCEGKLKPKPCPKIPGKL